MKRRIFTALLAGAMILSLAACGGGNGGGSSSSNPGGSSSDSSSLPDGSNPDGSVPDGSQPDASQPDGGSSSEVLPPDSSAVDAVNPLPTVTLTLNKTSVSLTKAGATFKVRCTTDPETDATPTYTSSNKEVATVDKNGTIKAVAPGKATITVECAGASAKVSVTCDWKVSQPAPDTSKPSGGSSSSSSSSSGSSSGSSSETPAPAPVDLSSFYSTITGKYQFSFMMEADDTMLSTFFPGLSDLSLSQCLVYQCGMSPSPNGDFVLIQVSDSKDVDTVKSILQARINYMVGDGNGPGGAFYPMEQTTWEEYSRITVNGNYIMLIAHESCDDIVKEFNALF